jgi:hypothetical protein
MLGAQPLTESRRRLHPDVSSPMVILAGEGGVVRHRPAGPPSNTAGIHQPEVRDRLAQASLPFLIGCRRSSFDRIASTDALGRPNATWDASSAFATR